MNLKRGSDYSVQRFPRRDYGQSPAPFRRPVWLPASSYYMLAAAVAVAFFFLVWGVFHEGDQDAPWVIAGIGASFVIGGAVVLREVYLRNARQNYLLAERELDRNLKSLPLQSAITEEPKISLEKNAALVRGIEKKSEAARSRPRVADGHLEVFELCEEYLSMAGRQMENAGVGSPRLAGLRRGREIVGELHRHHLLSWAEIETRELTRKAQNYVTISKKLNAAQEALSVLDTALKFYPNEAQLIESETALKNFISSVKVSHWIEQAERAAFKGNAKRAISLYRDALFSLAREDVRTEDRAAIAERINAEIESLRGLSAKKEIKKGTITD